VNRGVHVNPPCPLGRSDWRLLCAASQDRAGRRIGVRPRTFRSSPLRGRGGRSRPAVLLCRGRAHRMVRFATRPLPAHRNHGRAAAFDLRASRSSRLASVCAR
jgi:hypothetical protein